MNDLTIALDAMGGDYGPSVVVPAAVKALRQFPNLTLILVGQETALQQALAAHKATDHPRLRIQHAATQVGMDEPPSAALRGKRDSSMRLAINLVKSGDAQACVSAGNTGALMAMAHFVLRTLPGIDRPAILSEMPALNRTVRVLDLGANVDSCAEHLMQFALMGSILASALDGKSAPKVGLLNNGTEEIKGNDQVKRTAQLLSEIKAINYIGYVEGDDIFKGTADVVVCDGFVGNVMLKTSEGLAKLIAHYVKQAFKSSLYSKFAGLITLPILKRLGKQLDPSRYNGASFLGLQGIVIKSHGGANIVGFQHAIAEAVREVEINAPQLIADKVAQLLEEGELP